MTKAFTKLALGMLVVGTLGGVACGDDTEKTPHIIDNRQIVPSEGIPPEVTLQQANNNLDVIRHDDKIFLAFRTAPSHFASPEVELYVVSSTDEKTWVFEARFDMGTDLREPRLLSFGGRLFLYFAVLGDDPLDFTPQGMRMSEYLGPQNWSEPQTVYESTFIPWRTKTYDGVPYLMGYTGGGSIYDTEAPPVEIHFLTTSDGITFEPAAGDDPVVLTGGGSETAFVIREDGSLVSVVRNELGDESGFGSKVCRAPASDIMTWECGYDPKKYDSPLMFEQDGTIYLVGRRNLTETGDYDLGWDNKPQDEQHIGYELEYWLQPKRCSLWTVDPEALTVSFVLDFPSRGDTCFPGIIWLDERRAAIYNYSSPVEGEDLIWFDGQRGPTNILRSVLRFPRD